MEKAITSVLGWYLKTVKNWFSFLWKLEYFRQAEAGMFREGYCP